MKKDILISGVGGQGNIFAANVICEYVMKKRFEVLGTETIGAAQRGGSVVSHIRISDQQIYSPLIPPGRGDVLLGMEPLEALRHMRTLGRHGYYIVNLYPMPTVYTNLGIDSYPSESEIITAAKKACDRGYVIRATTKAAELGSTQMTNVVMLGALAKADEFFEYHQVREIVEKISPKRFLEQNMKAYEAGNRLL